MSYTVDWIGKAITIPTSDLTLVGGTEYDLDMSEFWLELRRLEADPNEGLWAPQILAHANTRTLAGTTFIMENEVINGYTVQFSGVATRVNLRADNDNLADVFVATGITLVTFNSAGNTLTVTGSGVTAQDKLDIADQVWKEILADHSGDAGSAAEALDNVAAGASPTTIAAAVWNHIKALTFNKWYGNR